MYRFQVILLIPLIYASNLDLSNIESTTEGMKILRTLQLQFISGDPIEHIIQVIEKMRDNAEVTMNHSKSHNSDYQEECSQIIDKQKTRINDLSTSKIDSSITLSTQSSRKTVAHQRLSMKGAQSRQMRRDLAQVQELRNNDRDTYLKNIDNLERALHSITQVRKVFIKYLVNNPLIVGKAVSYFSYEDDEADVEFALDDQNERYTKYAFINIATGVKKARESLNDMVVRQYYNKKVGFKTLLIGFEQLTTLLHSIQINSLQTNSKTEGQSDLADISKLVVQISENLIEWIGDLRRWEDQAEEAKAGTAKRLIKAIKSQQIELDADIQMLTDSVDTLDAAVERLQKLVDNSSQMKNSHQENFEEKQTACDQQQHDFESEIMGLQNELQILDEILDLMERKGGQLKQVISEKLYQ